MEPHIERQARVLGAVIAGGRSRRFGSDKALASVGGTAMLDHLVSSLRPQVDEIVVCGRAWRDLTSLEDRPPGRVGPVAGLAAALHHAAQHGFDGVISIPVHVVPLPGDLREALTDVGPAAFARQWLIGYWPIGLAPLADRVAREPGMSWRRWLDAAGAALIAEDGRAMANVNTRDDWARLPG